MDTRPDETDDITQPRLGPVGTLRFIWRQLTSMRTALLLLLLLAIAAVPGSIWPQRGIDAARVATYLDQHRTLGPLLDRLGFFDVYASPWFAAIYLLLFVSLVGCVLPRSRIHWHAMRAQPPRAPRRLERLPEHAELEVEASVEETVAASRAALRGKRFRIRKEEVGEDPHTLSGESGYLRETGNLVFHTALIVVIIGIAIGHLFGWRGDRIVPAGETFSNTISAYDTLDPGPWVDTEALTPFSVTINKLDVTFEERARGAQFGAPRDFTAHTTTTEGPGQPERQQTLKVNGPLQFGGASVFLLGNGYAPVVTVRDAKGNVTYSGATPFLPRDNNYLSAGAIKVGAAQPKQLGFAGFFLPTAEPTFANGPQSLFPDLKNPELAMSVWEGDLYPGGRPSSVYTLDTDHLSRVTKDGKPLLIRLSPGQTFQLPGGRGSITFDSVRRWAGLSVRYDPGKLIALVGAVAALAGLIASLTIRRRRVFVRVRPAGTPAAGVGPGDDPAARRTVVTIGGLAKGEDTGLGATVEDLLRTIEDKTTGSNR
jgi:cytochrome c biogenesis protein